MMWILAVLSFATPALAESDCSRDSDDMAMVSSELLTLYQNDRNERTNQDPRTLKNDKSRISTVLKYDRKGWICTPMDHFHAGWMLKRSTDPDDLKRAYDMAQSAMEHHVQTANWLTATAFDRWRVYRGQAQRYGSMFATKGKKLCIYETLEEATDAEREQFGLPPIAEQWKRVLEADGREGPFTLREVQRRNLICDPIQPR